MASSPKQFVWYELMTTDPEAAERFYAAVVGWTPKPWGDPDMRYTILHAGERGVGGIMELPGAVRDGGGRPGWVGYIHAPAIDAAVESLRAAGGAVHRPPTEIPNVGRFAVVADPQGAVFMLLEPQGEPQPPLPSTAPGNIGWRELYAADWDKVFGFYAGQFGWTKDISVDMGPMGTYQLFAAGAEPIGGMMNKPPQIPAPVWLYYFNVDAADAAAARVNNAGGQVLNGPMEVPGGMWVLQGMDPQGAMFALVAPGR